MFKSLWFVEKTYNSLRLDLHQHLLYDACCFSLKIDIHTARDSQNGFDNSGQALGFQWTSALSQEFVDQLTFQHWPIREARWMGHFDYVTATYPKINYVNIQHSLDVIAAIADRYTGHPAIVGLEPLNEPWAFCPIDILKVRLTTWVCLNTVLTKDTALYANKRVLICVST